MTFWEGFKAGAFAAVVWNLLRNPGGCACCAVLLVVLAIVLICVAVALVMGAWQYVLLAAAVLGVALVIRAGRR